jgi:FkbH-like protein
MKIAILGYYTTKILTKSLSDINSELEIYEADYSQVDYEIINDDSQLYKFSPDVVIIHETSLSFKSKYLSLNNPNSKYYENRINSLAKLIYKINSVFSEVKIIYPTLDINNDMTFGNYFFKVPESADAQVHYYNNGLTQLALEIKNLFLIDTNNLVLQNINVRDSRLVFTADIHFTISFTKEIALAINKIINNFLGKFIKCIILDLDNTLWGGVIGDDGLSGIQIGDLGVGKVFSEFQKWLKTLKERGIILCVCSKNNEKIAKEPFIKHTDMILSLDDIAVFVANWNNKVENIEYITKVLNIGYDSIVFIDDNPVEREMVKTALSEIIVPELPLDPALYKEFLIKENFFEITNYSKLDKERTKKYQDEAKRKNLESSSFNLDDYLKSLKMEAEFKKIDEKIFPRISQLTQRTNQFNARTVRYNESKIKSIANSKKYLSFGYKLEDKFGDHGLVGLVILHKVNDMCLFIDTLCISCRVFNRGFEYFIIDHIKKIMLNNGYQYLVAEWIPTEKNEIVKSFFSSLGFKGFENEKGKLHIDNIIINKHHIN